jgi:hypothetical protein
VRGTEGRAGRKKKGKGRTMGVREIIDHVVAGVGHCSYSSEISIVKTIHWA